MYLGVEQSISNRRWLGPALAIERDALTLHQQSDLPLPLCYVMARLGVAPAEVADFLNPTLRASMSDPLSVKDCATAAEILLTAIQNQQKIAIFADYDVDGGTSAALLIDFLQQFAMQPTLYVPDRITEGYGPNPKAMAALAESHDLIICVDCGTLAYEALEAARAADVVVLDHHLGAETLPEARAVVNPNRQDETGDLAHLRGGRGLYGSDPSGPDDAGKWSNPAQFDQFARPCRLGDSGRCCALDRGKPGLCAAGFESHGPAQTRGTKRPVGCSGSECCAKRLSSWLCLGTANQCRWANWQSGFGGSAFGLQQPA